MKASSGDPPADSAPHPGRRRKTSRRIHYWILALILLAVAGSFLFLEMPQRGAATAANAAAPPAGRFANWAIPRKHFLAALIRDATSQVSPPVKRPRHPRAEGRSRPGRWRGIRPNRPGSRRPTGQVSRHSGMPGRNRWTEVALTAHASPILAWASRAAGPRFRARRQALKTLVTRLGSPAPGPLRSGRLKDLFTRWSHRVGGMGTRAQRAYDRHWLKRQGRDPLPRAENILPPPASPTLMPGSVIPAVLESEIDSDLPGMIVARVTRTIEDSVYERAVMIPMGSTLVGYYSSEVSEGQTRVLASFSEIIFPDGARVPLAGMAAADAYGASGLEDEVRTHFWKIFGSSFLIAALSAFLPANQSDIVLTPGVSQGALVGSAAGQALVGTSQAILERNENIPPTLIIKPGFRFLVMVNRPIRLSGPAG